MKSSSKKEVQSNLTLITIPVPPVLVEAFAELSKIRGKMVGELQLEALTKFANEEIHKESTGNSKALEKFSQFEYEVYQAADSMRLMHFAITGAIGNDAGQSDGEKALVFAGEMLKDRAKTLIEELHKTAAML